MFSKNDKAIQYFDKLVQSLNNYESFDRKLGEGLMEEGTILFQTNKEARIKGRADALLKGKKFNEDGTPLKELETAKEDTLNELINREISNIFGE